MRAVLIISILIYLPVYSQHGVKLLYEELPMDSIPKLDVRTHSSVQPAIRWEGKLYKNDLLSFSSKKTNLPLIGLNPVIDLHTRYNEEIQYRFGGGLQLESSFAKPWYFRMNILAGTGKTDSVFLDKSLISEIDSNMGFNYLDLTGRVSYTPNKVFNFQTGIDNHFIGEGCRSLFLSDYGKPYPFAQIRSRFWRLEYSIIYQFMNEEILEERKAKFGATHHISFNATKWLNIGIFESVIFQPKDTALYRGFDLEYLNPVIFYRPQEYSLGSSDNVLLGISLSGKWKSHVAYAQFVIDEFSLTEIKAKSGWWANKYGGQLGIKGTTKHGKYKGFYRLEYNFLRPFTYAHLTAGQNYGNQGFSLAHPYGANVMEILAEFKIQNEKWLFKSFVSYFLQGLDKDGFSYGSNVYTPYTKRPYEYGYEIGEGKGNNGLRLVVSASYGLSKYGFLNIFIEQHLRYDSAYDRISFIPVIGIRSKFRNDYRNY